MIDRDFEIYPDRPYPEPKTLYFIEFSRWRKTDPWSWQLFRRQYLMGSEVHPWNLGEGKIIDHPSVVSMNTKSFLTFMVDALNEKSAKEDAFKPVIEAAEKRIYGEDSP